LRRVPIRDLVATGLLDVLLRVELLANGAKLSPAHPDETAQAVVQKLVGYIEVGAVKAARRKRTPAKRKVAR
jgi:hypothetical protein